ncbi:TPA: DUF2857 domain-containing protein [Escherichia coli]|nr:DUF2857 domain-containing protein [Escherichia coli]
MYPFLNYIMLTVVLRALREGNINYCEAMGFTHDEMNLIGKLSVPELISIGLLSTSFVDISVRHDILRQFLILSRNESRRHEQLNRAVRLGGSIALMNRYFGISSKEVCARRRLLGIAVPNGRTPTPDEETDAEIWNQWKKYQVENIDSPEALDAMMQVTENLSSCTDSPSLTVVWNCIMHYEREAAVRRIRRAR